MMQRRRGLRLGVLLVLSAAFAALWVRSYFSYDVAGRQGGFTAIFGSYHGHLLLLAGRASWSPPTEAQRWGHFWGPAHEAESTWLNIRRDCHLYVLGFGVQRWDNPEPGFGMLLTVPHWFPTFAVGWPTFRLAKSLVRERRRRRLGLCLQCGYDLHATPHRCPECGAPTPASGSSGAS